MTLYIFPYKMKDYRIAFSKVFPLPGGMIFGILFLLYIPYEKQNYTPDHFAFTDSNSSSCCSPGNHHKVYQDRPVWLSQVR